MSQLQKGYQAFDKNSSAWLLLIKNTRNTSPEYQKVEKKKLAVHSDFHLQIVKGVSEYLFPYNWEKKPYTGLIKEKNEAGEMKFSFRGCS